MAFYLLEADNFNDLTDETVYPTLIRRKTGPIPPDGQPDHKPSNAEDLFSRMVVAAFPKFVIRREVLLTDVCEIDSPKLALLLHKKHQSRPALLEEITKRATEKLVARIGSKRCDFLLFDPASASLRGAVEVDGAYHLKAPQVSFDYSKNLIFAGLGVVLLRLRDRDVESVCHAAPSAYPAALDSLLRGALLNWKTFNASKTVANMQLHLR